MTFQIRDTSWVVPLCCGVLSKILFDKRVSSAQKLGLKTTSKRKRKLCLCYMTKEITNSSGSIGKSLLEFGLWYKQVGLKLKEMWNKPSILNWRLLSWYHSYSKTIDFLKKIKLFKNIVRRIKHVQWQMDCISGLHRALSKLFTWCLAGLFWWAESESGTLI